MKHFASILVMSIASVGFTVNFFAISARADVPATRDGIKCFAKVSALDSDLAKVELLPDQSSQIVMKQFCDSLRTAAEDLTDIQLFIFGLTGFGGKPEAALLADLEKCSAKANADFKVVAEKVSKPATACHF